MIPQMVSSGLHLDQADGVDGVLLAFAAAEIGSIKCFCFMYASVLNGQIDHQQ